jgi:hypothetical protein
MLAESSSQMLEDLDESYICSRIADARLFNTQYREKCEHLKRQLDELDRKWSPDIARLDELYTDIMNRQEDLLARSRELGEITFLEHELSLLEQERDSDRFKKIPTEPLVELGILRSGENLSVLPQRIRELVDRYQRLTNEREAAPMGRDAARRRFLALKEMRRRMSKELYRNRAALEQDVEMARSEVKRLELSGSE